MKSHVRHIGIVIVILAAVIAGAAPIWAATNQATDGGGGGVALSPSNIVTITSSAMSIVKEARLLNGTLLTSPVSLPSNTRVWFVLYVDNVSSITASNARIVDVVAAGAGNFTVDNTTFQILNTVAAPGIDMSAGNIAAWAGAASWNALTWNALTAAVDPAVDQLDFTGNTVTIGTPNNRELDIVASAAPPEAHRVAFRFQATINP